ncbi:MAG: sensor histidine kinase [Terriglobales bacterium]
MHPLLQSWRRLSWYLAAWAPVAVLLGLALALGGGVAAGPAAGMAVALAVFFAFLCLPAWYSSRALPLAPSPLRPLTAQAASAAVAGLILVLAAELLASGRLRVAGAVMVGVVGLLAYGLVIAGYYLALQVRAAGAAREFAREAELRALKAQINPHFLYNSLNSISALAAADAAGAQHMCALLGDFLRRTLALGTTSAGQQVALSEDLALVRAYLAVEQIRFADRLTVTEQIEPAAAAAAVPPLLLQPLVENAIVHGIAHLLEGGAIAITAACAAGRLTISVSNPRDPEAAARPGTGRGLASVSQRLRAAFGSDATVRIETAPDNFCVSLNLPCRPA